MRNDTARSLAFVPAAIRPTSLLLGLAGLLIAGVGVGATRRQTMALDPGGAVHGKGEPAFWPVEDRLFAHDQVDNWGLGNAVALDGNRAIVGASRADINGEANRGAAYVFARQGGKWVEEAQLLAFDGDEGDFFGASVALSGDTAVVGAPLVTVGDDTFRGAAYVFQIIGGGWLAREKLLASDGASGDRLGSAVAVWGDTLMAGAPSADIDGVSQGAAYVYTRHDGLWSQSQKLFDEEGALADLFGNALALTEDMALVGAYSANIAGNTNQGAAYMYSRVGATWLLEQKLLASDGANPDQFGWSVALDGDVALVGAWQKMVDTFEAHGAAYVFRRSGTSWIEEQRLLPSEGQEMSFFGQAVALDGHVALIGAEHDFPGANQQGVVYEFRRSDGLWREIQRFTAPIGQGIDSFGEALALDSRRALIANRTNDLVLPLGGTVWVFGRPVLFADGFESGDTTAWSLVAQ